MREAKVTLSLEGPIVKGFPLTTLPAVDISGLH